ncbi:MAG: uracil phosphoribosyltransferase [Symbiobacteriaceae bacterium]|nr:uracil phosphoribosyltransferase [Symbiobacteriaceae bacterium]
MFQMVVCSHPLLQERLGLLRDKECSEKEFRRLLTEATYMLGYEATRTLETTSYPIETPLQATTAQAVVGNSLLIPILRAGLGMVDAMLQLLPEAMVGHIGLFRDHDTLLPVEYYVKIPYDLQDKQVFLLDPMLATGGSLAYALELLEQRRAASATLITLVSAPEGIRRIQNASIPLRLFTAAVDSGLNDLGYIVPGLGDAGDRLYRSSSF